MRNKPLNEGFFSALLSTINSMRNLFKSYKDYDKPGSPITLYCMDSLTKVHKAMEEFGNNLNKAKRNDSISEDIYKMCSDFMNTYAEFTKKVNDTIGPLLTEYNKTDDTEETTEETATESLELNIRKEEKRMIKRINEENYSREKEDLADSILAQVNNFIEDFTLILQTEWYIIQDG